jgi:sugar lactone lactonase YvrE
MSDMTRRACSAWVPVAALMASVALAATLGAQVAPPPEGAPTTPALRRLLDDDGHVERVATNFQFADGPVWIDGALVFTDAPRGQLLRWRVGEEPAVIAEDSGGASGLAIDTSRRLIAAEHDRKRVSRREDGELASVVERVGDTSLNGPTDLALAPDGTLYVVDPPPANDRTGTAGRVVRVSPAGAAEVVVEGLNRPSGVAVAGDGRELYVADAGRRDLRAYPLAAGARPGAPRTLASIVPWKRGVQGRPDGVLLDSEGRVYLAGPGGIWVLDRNGGRLGVIATPETPSACAFGDADGRTLYITAQTSIYKVRLNAAGR